MLYELKGEVLSVAVNSLGAELWRLEKNDEPERPFLWSGDPAVWPGRAPLLFPWSGAVEDGWFQVKGYTSQGHKVNRGGARRYGANNNSIVRRKRFLLAMLLFCVRGSLYSL